MATLPLLILLTPGLSLARNGDGGGFNGPDEMTSMIPESLDMGVSYKEVNTSVTRCFRRTFDRLSTALLGAMAQSSVEPTCDVGVSLRRREDSTYEQYQPGYLSMRCWTLEPGWKGGNLPSLQAVFVDPEYKVVTPELDDLLGYELQHDLYPVERFPRLEFEKLMSFPREYPDSAQSPDLVFGLAFAFGPRFEERGHALRLLDMYGRPQAGNPSVNGRDFVDCVQSEIQAKPDGSRVPAPDRAISECPELAPWIAISSLQTSADQEHEWEVRQQVVRRLFSDFERGLYEPDRIEGCLNSHPRRGEFFNTLQAEFYEGTIAHLRNARLPGLNAFMNQIDRQYSLNFRKPVFRLTGHFNHGSPDERFAGVHRATGSIYMDLSRIARDEWFVIFLHEMAHKVDKKLQQAVQDYALPWGLRVELEGWAKKRALSELPADVQEDLKVWLKSGLHRGLWAEYRAWLSTFRLYQEGLQEGLWKPVSRLERILAEKPSPQTLEAFLYDYLEGRATRPSGGIYSSPVVQEALDQILLEAHTAEGALEVGPAAEY